MWCEKKEWGECVLDRRRKEEEVPSVARLVTTSVQIVSILVTSIHGFTLKTWFRETAGSKE